jgi:hypothetical protein
MGNENHRRTLVRQFGQMGSTPVKKGAGIGRQEPQRKAREHLWKRNAGIIRRQEPACRRTPASHTCTGMRCEKKGNKKGDSVVGEVRSREKKYPRTCPIHIWADVICCAFTEISAEMEMIHLLFFHIHLAVLFSFISGSKSSEKLYLKS